MALIKCPDCGKEFSEYAECCPECGCPVDAAKENNVVAKPQEETIQSIREVSSPPQQPIEYNQVERPAEQKPRKNRVLYVILGIVLLCAIGIGAVFLLQGRGDNVECHEMSEEESLESIKALANVVDKYNSYRTDEGYLCTFFSDGLAVVSQDNKCGYINTKGELIIPCKYDEAWPFHEGMAKVMEGGKFGFINCKGELVIPCKYDYLTGDFHEGLAIVESNGEYYYIDKAGKEVITCKYDGYPSDFHEGLANVVIKGENCYINTQGEVVFSCEYDCACDFHDGLAVVVNGDWEDRKYGFINTKGEEVIPCKYSMARDFCEGLACIKQNGKNGFINTKGELVIPCKYDEASDFHEGLAGICQNGKWGVVNTTGEIVIQCQYDQSVLSGVFFSCGVAAVCCQDKWGYIDKQGNEVVPLIYDPLFEDCAEAFEEGFAVVEKDGKWGFVDRYGHSTFDFLPQTINNTNNSSPVAIHQAAIIDDADGYTNVRAQQSTKSDIVTQIVDNEVFYFDCVPGSNWVKVYRTADADQCIGYMHNSRVHPIDDDGY